MRPRWWRDYDAECLAWWQSFVTHPATTKRAMIAILVARFEGPVEGLPLCAFVPTEYTRPGL